MTRMKLRRMIEVLSKRSQKNRYESDDDIEKKSLRYRRKFFSRSGRRQQHSKSCAVAPSMTRSYRRKVSSRAGRRSRVAAQIRRLEVGDCECESDTDSQTTLTLEGGEAEDGRAEEERIRNRNDSLPTSVTMPCCLLPEVIFTEDNNSNNNNSITKNANTLTNPTASILNDVGLEGNMYLHSFNDAAVLPQVIVPATTGENDIEQDTTMNNDITITTTITAARKSLQLLFGGKHFHHKTETMGNNDAVSPLLTCQPSLASFTKFRLNYLGVYAAIMLADGLQGTHLYALYSGYGYSVANLYSLGFITGAITSPFIGPLVDRFGRKRSAMLYCILEIIINFTEQYEHLSGLIASRIVGGITTNLLSSVFESWLATEHRKRKFDTADDGDGDGDDGGNEPRLALVMRDSTIVSNMAAIVSGYIAHCLAARSGNGGPFAGAVFFTFVALVLVGLLWTENYGNMNDGDAVGDDNEMGSKEVMTFRGHMVGAFQTIVGDTKISRIGLIQGLTEGTLQTFVFLWSPALASFALGAPQTALGLGPDGEPAYGLIFGGFMACGVIGGVVQPYVRKNISTSAWSCNSRSRISFLSSSSPEMVGSHRREKGGDQNTIQTGILCALCYLFAAALLLIPYLINAQSPYAFSISLTAFLLYELLVGLYMPCQGVIRSIFMPKESTCSVMTMLRVVVNVAVALGVISTNYVSFTSAFATLSVMMVVAAGLQLSIVPKAKGVV